MEQPRSLADNVADAVDTGVLGRSSAGNTYLIVLCIAYVCIATSPSLTRRPWLGSLARAPRRSSAAPAQPCKTNESRR
eukprot:COSAG05_NODE_2179_length_3433_cov_5.910318_2_plen_78_part_00